MNRNFRKSQKGFTLIELMIVVAIIGILAAIAIPNFIRFQLKSKTSEAKVNIAAIRTAEEAYNAEFGLYVPATASPAAFGGTTKVQFVNVDGVGAGFDQIGWAPEGLVFFQYQVTAPVGTGDYTVDSAADIDGNGTAQAWGYVHPAVAGGPGVAGSLGASPCPNTGTFDPNLGTLTALNQVGPCLGTYGQSEF
jgi:type IV pilus assembly protein PilA